MDNETNILHVIASERQRGSHTRDAQRTVGALSGRLPVVVDDNFIANQVEWVRATKRPITIDAFRMPHDFTVNTLEGWMTGSAGDYLIRGVQGELYPCKEEIFEETYDTH